MYDPAETLIDYLRDFHWHAQHFKREDGRALYGILLESDDCRVLAESWSKALGPKPRGRPKILPSLFGNPYREEFERELAMIVKRRGKKRGAINRAINILAKKYRVQFDAMRKRIAEK
jgi:hypothetical protein